MARGPLYHAVWTARPGAGRDGPHACAWHVAERHGIWKYAAYQELLSTPEGLRLLADLKMVQKRTPADSSAEVKVRGALIAKQASASREAEGRYFYEREL
jgi:hypothetical protein